MMYVKRINNDAQEDNEYYSYHYAKNQSELNSLINSDDTTNNTGKLASSFKKDFWPSILIHNYGMISYEEKSKNPKYGYKRVVIVFNRYDAKFYTTTLYYSKNNQYQKQVLKKSGIKLNYYQNLGNNTFYLADRKDGSNNQFEFKVNPQKRTISMRAMMKNGKQSNTKPIKYKYVRNQKDMNKVSG